MTAPFSYIYIGSLFGDYPERTDEFTEDPRALQRRKLDDEALTDERFELVRNAIAKVTRFGSGDPPRYICNAEEDKILKVVRLDQPITLFVNLSAETLEIGPQAGVNLSSGYFDGKLEKYGYVLVKHERE